MQRALDDAPGADWAQSIGSIEWKRWCGRFQFAPSYKRARPEARCPEPKPKPKPKPVTETKTETKTRTQTTTVAPPPKQPPPPKNPPPPPPAPPGDELVGERGKVTLPIDNSTEMGEVEIKGERWAAQSETGEPIPEGTKVVVVRRDDRFLYVIPTQQ
jgi:hypothetical protein